MIDSKDCDGSNCEDASISIKFVCVSMWKHNECSFVGITGYSTSADHEEFDFASINWSRYYGIEDNSSDTSGFGTIISCVVYVLSLGLCLYLLNPRRGQQHILLHIWKEDLKRNRPKFTPKFTKSKRNINQGSVWGIFCGTLLFLIGLLDAIFVMISMCSPTEQIAIYNTINMCIFLILLIVSCIDTEPCWLAPVPILESYPEHSSGAFPELLLQAPGISEFPSKPQSPGRMRIMLLPY